MPLSPGDLSLLPSAGLPGAALSEIQPGLDEDQELALIDQGRLGQERDVEDDDPLAARL